MFEGQVAIDLDQRLARNRCVIGEGGNAEVMVEIVVMFAQPPFARQQHAGAIGRGAGDAERRAPFRAAGAGATAWHEDEDDVIADDQVIDTRA
jgi:hypothetical protein